MSSKIHPNGGVISFPILVEQEKEDHNKDRTKYIQDKSFKKPNQ